MTFLKTVLLFLVVSVAAFGQFPPLPLSYLPNDTSTGTTLNKFVKFTSAGKVVVAGASETEEMIGLCIGNCTTSGDATIQWAGTATVIVDGATTVGHYLKISASTAGAGTDTGATTYPTSGQPLGRVVVASSGSSVPSKIYLMFRPPTGGGSGDTVGPGSATDNALTRYDGPTGKLIQNSNALLDDAGNLTLAASLALTEMTAPSGVSGKGVLYTKSDHKLYAKLNNAGEDQLCTFASGCGSTPLLSSGLGIWTPSEYAPGSEALQSNAYVSLQNWVMQVTIKTPTYIGGGGFDIFTPSGTCGGTCAARWALFASDKTTRVLDSGALTSGGSPDINQNSTMVNFANTGGTVLVPAGTYFMTFCSTSTAISILSPASTGASHINSFAYRMNHFPDGTVRNGTGNNCTGSGGSLNFASTPIGTISADDDHTLMPAIVLYVP